MTGAGVATAPSKPLSAAGTIGREAGVINLSLALCKGPAIAVAEAIETLAQRFDGGKLQGDTPL
jgi:hypothetical protein